MNCKLHLIIFILISQISVAQFTSSNLPIISIDTDGEDIPDEPKIKRYYGHHL